MCEINPKRKAFYRLEFFTTKDMSDRAWLEFLSRKLNELEQAFNETGVVRVHVHEQDDDENARLRDALELLRFRGGCWCMSWDDNPPPQAHSLACQAARAAVWPPRK